MARKLWLSLRALLIVTILGFSFSASALPMSPKWMKSAGAPKAKEPSGELGDGNPVGGGGGPLALPLPGSIWLMFAGAAGIAIQRRK